MTTLNDTCLRNIAKALRLDLSPLAIECLSHYGEFVEIVVRRGDVVVFRGVVDTIRHIAAPV